MSVQSSKQAFNVDERRPDVVMMFGNHTQNYNENSSLTTKALLISIFSPLACWLGSKFTSSSKAGLAVPRARLGLGAACTPNRNPEVTLSTDLRDNTFADNSVDVFDSINDEWIFGPMNA